METNPNYQKLETDILQFWEDNEVFKALKDKDKGNPPFRFLDGPITANNPMGVHHAWGRSIKDSILRYKAMNGYSCHYRNGFDTQGLWVEVEVEKELGFKDKKDIEKYGLEHFTKKCEERIKKYSGIITEQSKRLGQWMDWENSYYTHTDENITAIWYFLKKCDENGWLTQSHRPMPWCPRCGTSLSEHEMAGSHKELTHTSVFGMLPVKDRDFNILVWTTTPWTLVANVALAVNPNLTYVSVSLLGHEKPVVMAKSALQYIDGEKKVLKLFPGSDLVGLEYETFFPFLAVQDFTHTIVPWEDVADDEGSGVVHIAPGCGAEDFELGLKCNLPQICPVNESGIFTKEYGFLAGLSTTEAAPVIFKHLEEHKKLYKTMEYTHQYPVCWRCKHEVLFRLIRSWTIKTDEIRPKLIEASRKVKWEPSYIGKRMEDWLSNMGDWNISRKRYYGLPLPFYHCEECGHTTVVSSKEELRALGGEAVDTLPELHRPWIDSIKIRCPHCGNLVSRIPEVGDVWLDAGITPFSTLGYFTEREKWKTYFPAEWVTEMREQVRLWFYSLLFMSVTLVGEAPYQRVLAYNSVVAEDGTKFSKTGFMIRFDEAAEKIGADAIRYLFAGASTSSDVRFGFSLGEEARRKLMGFWNICVFFETYAEILKPNVKCNIGGHFTDGWLENYMSKFVSNARTAYDDYRLTDVIKLFEESVDDISNWYVRINRRRFWNNDASAFACLYQTIKIMIQVIAPIVPFMSEHLWQNLIRKYDAGEVLSVHLSDFPTTGDFDSKVFSQAAAARQVIAMALKLRNEAQIKVKQPLSEMMLLCNEETKLAVNIYENVILDELNIKKLTFIDNTDSIETLSVQLNFRVAGSILKSDLQAVKNAVEGLSISEMKLVVDAVKSGLPVTIKCYQNPLDASLFTILKQSKSNIVLTEENGLVMALHTKLTQDLINEGYYRELLRQCQVMRKEIGLQINERIVIAILSEKDIITNVVLDYYTMLKKETLADEIFLQKNGLSFEKQIVVGGNSVIIEMGSTKI